MSISGWVEHLRRISGGTMAGVSPAQRVSLLTRAGCASCAAALTVLESVLAEFGLSPAVIDVDEVAKTDPELRAEFGDRLPVVLLDGAEHSYWDVDVVRLRRDLRS